MAVKAGHADLLENRPRRTSDDEGEAETIGDLAALLTELAGGEDSANEVEESLLDEDLIGGVALPF